MKILSPGKIRALQTASTKNGIFNILAIDHRDSLRIVIDPDHPEVVSAASLTTLKLAIIEQIAPHTTAVMLEPEYSAAQAIVAGALPGHVGFLSALEEQGYLGNPYARQTTLLNGWSVAQAKRLGASGIKLLIFYHPDAEEAAERQETLVKAVVADCAREEIPLFLEPLAYPLDPAVPVHSAEFAAQRRRIVVETARRLGALGPDILKMQFPLDAKYDSDEGLWRDACAELNEAAPVPWALLSGGDPYDSFKVQVRVACQSGCSGFMAGRALWREAIGAAETERTTILRNTVLPRFEELSHIANTHGQGWQIRYTLPVVDEAWFRGYEPPIASDNEAVMTN
ncbi:MAG: tagatose 1,6-diphosphate aldolase [Chloroflexales bacterium]|nr:tagatose 1,6-diphosphate aldolase [Chloroflexales bacterium]